MHRIETENDLRLSRVNNPNVRSMKKGEEKVKDQTMLLLFLFYGNRSWHASNKRFFGLSPLLFLQYSTCIFTKSILKRKRGRVVERKENFTCYKLFNSKQANTVKKMFVSLQLCNKLLQY